MTLDMEAEDTATTAPRLSPRLTGDTTSDHPKNWRATTQETITTPPPVLPRVYAFGICFDLVFEFFFLIFHALSVELDWLAAAHRHTASFPRWRSQCKIINFSTFHQTHFEWKSLADRRRRKSCVSPSQSQNPKIQRIVKNAIFQRIKHMMRTTAAPS